MKAALILISFALLSACQPPTDEPVRGQAYLLGTALNIAIHDAGHDREILDTVFERVAVIEARMSTTEADYETTELLEVNRAAGERRVAVSPDTFEVLAAAREFSRLSNGAFDVTIWPLVRLWGIGSENAGVPGADRLEQTVALVDWQAMELGPGTSVFLPREGMGVDVGAIAKGYAADEAAAILREAGVAHALLDFGGNILVIGDKPDGTPWRIGVQRPDAERNQYLGIAEITDRTIVTSGTYERYFVEGGVRYHHILDAETGFPAENDLQQVTIIADSSMHADALSTATFVLGLEAGRELVESLPSVEAVFVTNGNRVHLSSGAAELFTLTDPDYTLVVQAN